jgi:hypothetical protein
VKRGKPLARKTRLSPRRKTPRRSGRVLDPDYLDRVRALPCYVCSKPGPSDPDHMGEHPYGRKADDDTCVPMCRVCHRMRTDGKLRVFVTMIGFIWTPVVKFSMRAFCDDAIARTRTTLGWKPKKENDDE